MEFSKSELVEIINEQTDDTFTKKDIDFLLTVAFDAIVEKLVEGERVELHEFGSFKVATVAARTYRNPKTGEPVEKGERFNIKFKAAKKVKKDFLEVNKDLIG